MKYLLAATKTCQILKTNHELHTLSIPLYLEEYNDDNVCYCYS